MSSLSPLRVGTEVELVPSGIRGHTTSFVNEDHLGIPFVRVRLESGNEFQIWTSRLKWAGQEEPQHVAV